MKINKEQFDKAQKTFSKRSLSDTQKNSMLSSIYSENSVPVRPVVSPLSSYFMFFKQKTFIAITVIILLISGTSYASAQSLPGDLLYPVKTEILEPIALALRFSEESKNEYKVKLLEKRLAELEELEKKGKLTKNEEEKSSKATNKNVKDIESSAVFDAGGENEDVSSKIRSYNNIIVDEELRIESNVIVDIEENNESDTGDSDVNSVDSVLETEEELDIDVENTVDVELESEPSTKTEIEEEIEKNIDSEISL